MSERRSPLWFRRDSWTYVREDGVVVSDSGADPNRWFLGVVETADGSPPQGARPSELRAWADEHVPLGPVAIECALAVLATEIRDRWPTRSADA